MPQVGGPVSLADGPIGASQPFPFVDKNNPESVALDQAQRTGERVELVSRRSEMETTYANPQGTLTTEISSGPVRVQKGDGFEPIDTTLEASGDTISPKAAQGNVRFSNGGPAGSEFAAVGPAGGRVSFKSEVALPAPTLKGNTATYADIAPGQDLVLKALTTGFESFVILKSRPTQAPVITIPVGLDGLNLSKDPVTGELKLSDDEGEAQLVSSTAMMWSAARDPKVNEPTQIRPVDVQIERGTAGTQLILRPSMEFLSDPATVYPISIDPAATLTTITDTYVSKAAPTSTFSTTEELKVGRVGADPNNVFRSFLKFNTSTIANKVVYAATLYLTQLDGYTCGSSSMWVDKASGVFSSTTWNSQPTVDGAHWYNESWSGGALSCPNASGPRTLDIRGLANAWSADGTATNQLALLAPDEGNQDHFRKFGSSESIWPPSIAVEYDPQSNYPAPGSATAVPGNGQATVTWPEAVFPPQFYGAWIYRGTPGGWVLVDSVSVATNQVPPRTATFSNLINGDRYIVQVKCFGNGVWGLPVNSNWFTPAPPPSAPTVVKATPLDAGGMVEWTGSSNGFGATIGAYEVTAFNAQNQAVNHAVVNHPATSVTFSSQSTNNGQGLTNFLPYYFKVKAYNTSGMASADSTVSNTIVPEPASDGIGLEDFYPYQDFALGQGTAFANMANGNLVVQDVDFDVPGQGLNMRLTRTYNANNDAATGPFGRGWSLGVSDGDSAGSLLSNPLDLSQTLKLLFGGAALVFTDQDGTRHRFVNEGGVWKSPPGVNLTLSYEPILGNATLTRPDGVSYKMQTVNSKLRMDQIIDRKGNFLDFAYTGDKLSSITDVAGRSLAFTQPADLITQVNFNSAGQSMQTNFGYGGAAGDRLVSVVQAAGTSDAVTTEYTYSSDGLRTVEDARDNSTTFSIPGGKLDKITDRAGKEWTFGYTSQLCPAESPQVATCLTDPEVKTSIWKTNAQGNLMARRDAGDKDSAGVDRFNTETFDWAANRLTSNTDQAGNTTTYSYNPLGQISGSVATGAGDPTFTSIFDFAYPAPGVGQMTKATTASGTAEQRVWEFTYDQPNVKGTLLTSKDPLGKVTTMTYYDRGMLKTVEDANGKITTYGDTALGDGGYDASGHPGKITDPLGKVSTFGYHFLGFQETRVDRNNQTWTTDHDRRGNLVSSVTPATTAFPLGKTTTFCYDANDNQTLAIPPRGTSRACTPDGTDGWSTKTTYDARDLISSTVTKPGAEVRKSTYAYYNDGALEEIVEPRSFDAVGGPDPDPDELQKVRYLRYPNNRVSGFIDEEGDQTDVLYTPHGLVSKVTDPAGDAGRHTMEYTYNRLGQVKSAQESGHAKAMRYDYNLHGDTTKVTTPRETFTLFNPDKMGRPLTITDPKDKVTTREYDNVGNLKLLRQPTGNNAFTTTNYFYTDRNEIDYETDPADAAHVVDYVYDYEGRQSFRHDRRGTVSPSTPLDSLPIERTTQQTFNADGTLAERKATGTGLSEHRSVFGYDADGNTTSLNTHKDGSANANVSGIIANYTSAGELDEWWETLYPPTGGAAVTKTGSNLFAQDGLLKSNTTDGQTSGSTWFLDGNEETFTPYGGFGSFTSTYEDNGALEQMTFPNSAQLAQNYNLADLATSRIFTNSTGAKLSAWESIGYDENNNRETEAVTQAQPAGSPAVTPGTGTYGYDDLDRLDSFKHPFETTTAAYGLDDAGNVKTEPGTTFTFTDNRLITRTPALPALPSTYGYDHFGNQVSDTEIPLVATTTTSYNAASQTRRVTAGDGSWVEYNYDGLDRMISRHDSAGSTMMFFHDGLSQQIAVETDPAGTVKTRYLVDAFGVPRGKLDIDNATGRSYYVTDPRGNITQMIGASDQAVKAVFAYDPYGKDKAALSKKLTANWDSRLKFQMAPKDPKTGSYSLGSRLMDPTINRFIGADNYVAAGANLGLQVDPLTGNRYLYAGANPAGMIDDGHGWCVFGHVKDKDADSRCRKTPTARRALELVNKGASVVQTGATFATLVCPVCLPVTGMIAGGATVIGLASGTGLMYVDCYSKKKNDKCTKTKVELAASAVLAPIARIPGISKTAAELATKSSSRIVSKSAAKVATKTAGLDVVGSTGNFGAGQRFLDETAFGTALTDLSFNSVMTDGLGPDR
ncbi:MAG TPA: DNRLRE domain-containing protein [Actinomycetota bacterium]|nr:DNRLRE domain-containing protein [Actinomycetota bacterium]